MQLKDIMIKKVVSLKNGSNLGDVLKTFSKNKINSIPIVDGKKNLIGIVTKADIIKLLDIHSKIQESYSKTFPLVLGILRGQEHLEDVEDSIKKILTVPVSEFMTSRVYSISPDKDAYDAIRKMSKYKIDNLPVINKRKLVGIVTRTDIINKIEKDVKR